MPLYNHCDNVINYPFIDYIIKCYVPELQSDVNISKKVNMSLFKDAMFHNSAKMHQEQNTYERLEYLGDAIFHMIITEYLYKRYDEENEGFLTRIRIRIERGDSMAELTKKLELQTYIQMSGMSINEHILEDVFEAFIGAFYLNFGMAYTKLFVIKLIERHKDLSELIFYDDNYKDLLLRYFHQMKWGHPIYKEGGRTDCNRNGRNNQYNSKKSTKKVFTVVVRNPFMKKIGRGTSTSKKQAEQLASKSALKTLGVIIGDEIDTSWMDKIDKTKTDKAVIDKAKADKNADKKPLSVYNPENKLIKRCDIANILVPYNVVIPKNTTINMRLFHEALTHRSYLVRKRSSNDDSITKMEAANAVKLQKKSNERLQFLGDSIIHFVIGDLLYHKYPTSDEGFLTRLRCKLENRESLFYLAKQTGIDSYLLVSQNIEILHGRNNINIIGGGFEAFIGALYLESGLSITKQFILQVLRIELDIVKIAENETNYKDLILQLYNKKHWGHPQYKVIKEEGPDHCKVFTMGIYLNNKLMGKGIASTKKKAEQIASKQMYMQLTAQQN